MGKKKKSIGEALADVRTPHTIHVRCIDWIEDCEREFRETFRRLEKVLEHHKNNKITAAMNDLRSKSEARMRGARTMVTILTDRIRGLGPWDGSGEFIIRARTSGGLRAELDIYNSTLSPEDAISVSWGRDHLTGAWYVLDANRIILDEDLDFDGVVAYVQSLVNQREYLRDTDDDVQTARGSARGEPRALYK